MYNTAVNVTDVHTRKPFVHHTNPRVVQLQTSPIDIAII